MENKKHALRESLRQMLGIPHIPTEPRKEFRGSVEGTGYLVEK